ncbi:MAG: HD domain-containing protein [bacterium]
MAGKTVRDPVHGDLDFTAEELAVIDTGCFQRLRQIKQLGAAHLVYPGAVHTRFEHSLGTCGVAGRMIAAIRENCGRAAVSAEDERLIRLYALVHDITHIPFGHTLEDERRVFPRHDRNRERIRHFLTRTDLAPVLERLELRESLLRLMTEHRLVPGGPTFHYDIVAGTICADLLDYLERDCYFTGLSQRFDERIYKYFVVDRGGLAVNLVRNGLFRMDGLSEITNLLRMRYVLSERVYYHPAKNAASAMLSKALELCLAAPRARLGERALYDLGDEGLLRLVSAGPTAARHLARNYLARRLYKKAYMVSRRNLPSTERFAPLHLDPAARQRAERRLARRLSVPFQSVIVYCPSAGMQLREANARFRLEPGRPARVLEHNQELVDLRKRQEGLWKFFVFLDPDCQDRLAEAGRCCAELFEQPNEILAPGELPPGEC